ncbi:GDP-L-fucose synthase family protein [Candidatus Protochlamydia phocaeensis]|uniref:GDP-L-fucose synthase family protein n=1 Tax=Candidatus Protochlamydia phocaeensis TaxID=1414722 RepID=UPI0008392AB6
MPLNAKIYVAGHNGLVGSALVRKLQSEGYTNLLTRSSQELDLTSQQAVNNFFEQERPDYVFLAAAKVGGIKANMDYPAEFIYTNLMIETNVIHAAYVYGVKKLLFLGSSCIYPKECPQPMLESYLLTGPLEPTNEPYAIAKIAGLKLCESYNRQYGTHFISCMPTNLYGPNDNFDLQTSHVLPGLLRKFQEAKEQSKDQVTIWGSGSPRREFLHVDDLANACLFLMRYYEGNETVNIGCGEDLTIAELAFLIKDAVGYQGNLVFDPSYPDGTPQKLLNIHKIRQMGWKPTISLKEGIQNTVEWYNTHSH